MSNKKKPEYVIILNYSTKQMDVANLNNMPEGADVEEYIKCDLGYDLSDCHWMVVEDYSCLNMLN